MGGHLQLSEERLQSVLGDFTDHDLHHLLANDLLLRVLRVAGGLNLALVAAGECNAEHAEHVAIRSLSLHEGFNERVPLLNEGTELVTGHIHAVEVGVAVISLDFFDLELNLPPSILVVLVLQVSERNLEHTTTERVGSNLWKIKVSKNATKRCRLTYSGQQSCCRA